MKIELNNFEKTEINCRKYIITVGICSNMTKPKGQELVKLAYPNIYTQINKIYTKNKSKISFGIILPFVEETINIIE